ncbi:MAG: class I SAM-dependent methyltransferase [Ardenticatenaceae bacterium]|nr:class I SAM-dependent methyltransferase [Ardenticatenaceae bacterium]
MDDQNNKSLPSTLYTEEYFLTACEGYDVFIESEGVQLSRRLKDSFAMAEVTADMRILDVGCGRGEILRHCMEMGIEAYGIDYADAATGMSQDVIDAERTKMAEAGQDPARVKAGVCRSDAKYLPFPSGYFDRVLMFDVVEHLYPWELHAAMLEVRRVLKDDGRFIIHTAPNRWYDKYAYPWVRRVRTLLGEGNKYPKDPRAITAVNLDVHVNEQDMRSMKKALNAAGFKAKVWLDSPPQNRQESALMAGLRRLAFDVPPFRWFFEREVFAIGEKDS